MAKAENKLCLVQFIHPGGEHTPKKGDEKLFPWNKEKYRRKFLKSKGIFGQARAIMWMVNKRARFEIAIKP